MPRSAAALTSARVSPARFDSLPRSTRSAGHEPAALLPDPGRGSAAPSGPGRRRDAGGVHRRRLGGDMGSWRPRRPRTHDREPSSASSSTVPPSAAGFVPRTTREGARTVMPVTFPDGSTAELVYPPPSTWQAWARSRTCRFYGFGILDLGSSWSSPAAGRSPGGSKEIGQWALPDRPGPPGPAVAGG